MVYIILNTPLLASAPTWCMNQVPLSGVESVTSVTRCHRQA